MAKSKAQPTKLQEFVMKELKDRKLDLTDEMSVEVTVEEIKYFVNVKDAASGAVIMSFNSQQSPDAK